MPISRKLAKDRHELLSLAAASSLTQKKATKVITATRPNIASKPSIVVVVVIAVVTVFLPPYLDKIGNA